MEVELEQVEKELRECKGLPPADKLATYLRLCRELRIRDSPSIARYGSLLLRHYKSFLSEDELWIVYEQCAIAALDAQATEFAASLIRAINKKFANSVRAKRLQAMYYEAIGELDRAETLYRQLLEISPNNEMVVKRMAALERSRGSLQGAAEALKKYVDTYPNDADAWEELAELYVELGLYRQAAFCYEELIMINPLQSNYNVRYADVLYTIGGNANWKIARAYYARVIEQTRGGSLRALYGVCACSANITDKVSVQDSRSRAQIELPEVTAQALQRVYKKEAAGKLPLVQDLLKKMGIL